MFAAGIASLVGAAAYAYSYNLGRFRFNALQRQECLHHYQESIFCCCRSTSQIFEQIFYQSGIEVGIEEHALQ